MYVDNIFIKFYIKGVILLVSRMRTKQKKFESELNATQVDFWKNGRDNAVRRKSMHADPLDCSVSVNFDTANCTEKWSFKVALANVDEISVSGRPSALSTLSGSGSVSV